MKLGTVHSNPNFILRCRHLRAADRMVRVYNSAPGVVRFVLASSPFYCGIFSLCVVTFLEIDNVQLKLLNAKWTGPATCVPGRLSIGRSSS